MAFCYKCGAQIVEGDPFCGKCGAKLVPVVPQPAEAVAAKGSSGKLIAGGISGIIAGVASLLMAILILVGANSISEEHGVTTRNILVVGATIGLILGILGITGCSYALARKNFRFSLAGGICAFLATIFSFSFIFVVPILLGIVAMVLIALSGGDFKKE
jgi:hypothetical protein